MFNVCNHVLILQDTFVMSLARALPLPLVQALLICQAGMLIPFTVQQEHPLGRQMNLYIYFSEYFFEKSLHHTGKLRPLLNTQYLKVFIFVETVLLFFTTNTRRKESHIV